MNSSHPNAPMATGSVDVSVDPGAAYALITDLGVLASLAEEAHAMAWVAGARAEVGAIFAGRNRNGLRRWSTRCTVTDAAQSSVFAFDVTYGPLRTPVAHWRYEFTATDSGCRVVESMWDRRPGWFRSIAGIATGVSDRETTNTQHIAVTLQRLKGRTD